MKKNNRFSKKILTPILATMIAVTPAAIVENPQATPVTQLTYNTHPHHIEKQCDPHSGKR